MHTQLNDDEAYGHRKLSSRAFSLTVDLLAAKCLCDKMLWKSSRVFDLGCWSALRESDERDRTSVSTEHGCFLSLHWSSRVASSQLTLISEGMKNLW